MAGFKEVGGQAGIEVVAEIRHKVGATDFSPLLPRIEALKPDILCAISFGRDQQIVIRQATDFDLKRRMRIIVPVLLYTAGVAGGTQAFDGVIGGSSYYWGIEDKVGSAKAFNERYRKAYNGKVPSDYGALGYAGVRSVLEAARQAGTSETEEVVDTLATLKYDFYKGPQHYRSCDHQSVQSVFIIGSNSKDMSSPHNVFSVLAIDDGSEEWLRTCQQQGHA